MSNIYAYIPYFPFQVLVPQCGRRCEEFLWGSTGCLRTFKSVSQGFVIVWVKCCCWILEDLEIEIQLPTKEFSGFSRVLESLFSWNWGHFLFNKH